MSKMKDEKREVGPNREGDGSSNAIVEDLLDDALVKVSAAEALLYALSESIEEISSPEDALHVLSKELNEAKSKIAKAREALG